MTPQLQTSISGPAYCLFQKLISAKALLQRLNVRDLLSTNDFWCCIIRTATGSLQERPIGHDVAQPKVSDLDIQVIIQQETR